ncbi:MAG: 50S ribosomal protein L11 methyltransferase [Bacteroidia bacterium]|jgi:ribosomal protein L11 methyltransferase|nr:50S ribosomal protein L11 methyltransferase [Bacteroidia bacterium]
MEAYFEFSIRCNSDIRDQLIAELAEEAYEGFVETDAGFSAYVLAPTFNRAVFEQLLLKYGIDPNSVAQSHIEQQNWNAQWEAAYEPIVIGEEVIVKAPFHLIGKEYPYELLIQPKNTFGTGHHETTQLMLQLMLQQNLQDKSVFDYGTGTGVLAIMASKMEAKSIFCIDIDDWSADNILENTALNQVNNIHFQQGDLNSVQPQLFDVILANINKNILLYSFDQLSALLTAGGSLLISGFYESDLADLKTAAFNLGFHFKHHLVLNDWCAAQFVKS